MNKHENTFLELNNLNSRKFWYQPTFDFPCQFINKSHEFYSMCPTKKEGGAILTGIPGKLSRDDALKLYEIAYFVLGDILELGAGYGLSASILLKAIRDSRNKRTVYSVDIEPKRIALTRENIAKLGFSNLIQICDDAASAVRKLAGRDNKFDFVFIDHSHAYKPVFDLCCELPGVLNKNAFCLFHDFNTRRNADPKNEKYKVYQAVKNGLNSDFEFYGIYRSAALYRYK